MIRLAILLLISFSVKVLHAQSTALEINKSLETVIQLFPSGLSGIKGQTISQRAQISEYHSSVNINGAASAVITEQQLLSKKVVSWKTTLYITPNVEEIKTKYREIFLLLNNSIVKSDAEKPFILSGKFREPFLTRTAVSHFSLLPSTGELKDIKLDLSIERIGKNYALSVMVYGE